MGIETATGTTRTEFINLDGDGIDLLCTSFLDTSNTAIAAMETSADALALATMYPDSLEPVLTYALIRERTRVKHGMLELWADVHKRFPDSFEAQQYYVRWMTRSDQTEAACELIQRLYPGNPSGRIARLHKAELLWEVKDHETACTLFQAVVEEFPDNPKARVMYAKRLKEHGRLLLARDLLEPVVDNPGLSPGGRKLVAELSQAIDAIKVLAPEQLSEDSNLCLLALQLAIRKFEHRTSAQRNCDTVGSVAMITGGLGPGGAERQLARAAAWFETIKSTTGELAGMDLKGPFEVVVKSLSPDGGKDFFLDVVRNANVATRQINDMPAVPYEDLGIDDTELLGLLHALPPIAAYGVQRLVNYFREAQTEIAFIWQDGAVLFAALAALISGVPKIVLNIRGFPPVVRRHLYRPEYDGLYRALSLVNNIEFVSNNKASAKAYSEWLGIPLDRFAIILNGVEELPATGTEAEHTMWTDFEARTPDATETIGGVFRFNTDKRPALWVGFARQYLTVSPHARFVLVGGGRLLEECRELARQYGIIERILFTGSSSQVGYWLSKMDVFVLLSRFEGLPNVLIEAQLSGVTVVSTPAGGATETFLEGETGLALSCAENPDIDELCGMVLRILREENFPGERKEHVISFARSNFSTHKMVAKTAHVLARNCDPN